MTDKRCVLPWIHLAATAHGETRLCCISGQSYLMKGEKVRPSHFRLGETKISDILHSDEMQSIRHQMSAGETPTECEVCERNENLSANSKRLIENKLWGEGAFVEPKLRYLDLRFGNACNLACVTCSTRDSSGWEARAVELVEKIENPLLQNYMSHVHQLSKPKKDTSWYRKGSAFWNDLISHLSDLESVYFAGGEPLIQKEHQEFLDEAIRSGSAAQMKLRYSTNATIISDELIEKWRKFRKVSIAVSMDSFAEKNDYIRYGSSWKSLVSNVRKLESQAQFEVTCTKTVHNFNLFYLPEFVEKLSELQIFQNQRIDLNLLYTPRFLSVQALPIRLKERVAAKLLAWNGYGPFSGQIDKVLAFMNAADTSDCFHEFFQFTEALDQTRGSVFKTTFPEWNEILHEI